MIGGFQQQQAIALNGNISREKISADFLGEHGAPRWACGGFDPSPKAPSINGSVSP